MPIKYTEMSITGTKKKKKKNQHVNFFLVGYVSESQNIYACADVIFEQERKTQYLQTWHWSVLPNESSRDFGPAVRSLLDAVGPSLLSATDLGPVPRKPINLIQD